MDEGTHTHLLCLSLKDTLHEVSLQLVVAGGPECLQPLLHRLNLGEKLLDRAQSVDKVGVLLQAPGDSKEEGEEKDKN